jgi:hypothetical protein
LLRASGPWQALCQSGCTGALHLLMAAPVALAPLLLSCGGAAFKEWFAEGMQPLDCMGSVAVMCSWFQSVVSLQTYTAAAETTGLAGVGEKDDWGLTNATGLCDMCKPLLNLHTRCCRVRAAAQKEPAALRSNSWIDLPQLLAR